MVDSAVIHQTSFLLSSVHVIAILIANKLWIRHVDSARPLVARTECYMEIWSIVSQPAGRWSHCLKKLVSVAKTSFPPSAAIRPNEKMLVS
jgi:hypothetical protein